MTYQIGQNYAIAIVNDDYSALEDNEIEGVKEWCQGKGHIVITDGQVDFRRCPISGLLDDCIEVTTI